jgi:hypothetical protein
MHHDPDLIFSLGPNCRNTWNLRAHFGFDRAYPFDWWITPAKSMLRLLDRSKPFAATREDLVIAKDGGMDTVYNRRLNLLHHHDFDRDGPRVRPLTDEGIEKLNGKYRMLFDRLWTDVAAAQRPLAVLNGIFGGWATQTPDGGSNAALNGTVEPQALIDGIRDRLGAKVEVLIIDIGAPRDRQLQGGRLLRRPDRNIRHGLPRGQAYAEPIHVFRDAYAEMGLTPEALRQAEEARNLAISNNTPRVRSA